MFASIILQYIGIASSCASDQRSPFHIQFELAGLTAWNAVLQYVTAKESSHMVAATIYAAEFVCCTPKGTV
jgi:hypothetical protein